MGKTKGKTLCVFSGKGGVGKSITALNIAGVFSCLNQKILIVDLDLSSGSIATYLNKTFDKTIFNFMDDYINNRFNNISEYAIKYNENISFVSACKDPRQGSQIEENYIKTFLEKAAFEYDSIIIDMNHTFSEFNVNLLDDVDMTLLIMTNDLIDLKNIRNIISIFKDANKDNYKVLLNNSINPNKNYYSMYDIKNIIGHSINYKIDSKFYLKNIDNYIIDGKIITLDKKVNKLYPNAYKTFLSIASDLMEVKK